MKSNVNKIAINGFGRIGRLVFRQLMNDSTMKVVAINDLTDPKMLAYLLKHDSAQGPFNQSVSFTENALIVDGQTIPVYAVRDPADLPWSKLAVDVVVESTGFFTKKEDAMKHIEAGAKKVAISAPGTGEMKTVVFGVNENVLKAEDKIISAASCTTNCLAPMAKVLDDTFGIVKGFMTTVHAYTSDQRLVDAPHRDKRRARAAGVNIVPTSTGAAKAIGLVLPQLKGRLDGIAMRVPVITGSVVDLVVELKKDATVESINQAMKKHASPSFQYNEEEIVSSDIIGSHFGSIFDATLTHIVEVDGKKIYKTVAWYDNESSYVTQYVRTLKYFANL